MKRWSYLRAAAACLALLIGGGSAVANPIEDRMLGEQAFNISWNIHTTVNQSCRNWRTLAQGGATIAQLRPSMDQAATSWLLLVGNIVAALNDPATGPKVVNGVYMVVGSSVSPGAVVTEFNKLNDAIAAFNNADKTTLAAANVACTAMQSAIPDFVSLYP